MAKTWWIGLRADDLNELRVNPRFSRTQLVKRQQQRLQKTQDAILMARKVTKYKQRTKAQPAMTKTGDFLSLIYFLLATKRLPATLLSHIISSHIQRPPSPPKRHTHFGAYQRQQIMGGERKFLWHEPPDDGVSSRFVKEKIEHCCYYCRYSSQRDHR